LSEAWAGAMKATAAIAATDASLANDLIMGIPFGGYVDVKTPA
jgi:hypothetical protein